MNTLAISAPCTQPWIEMNPAPSGRHCVCCQKVVHDFTKHTDAELIAWFAQQHGPVCGRLRNDQLNVPLYTNRPVASKGIYGLVRWALALVLGWQSASCQPKNPGSVSQGSQQTVVRKHGPRIAAQDTAVFYVHGRVVDSFGSPQAYILVEKVDSGWFTTTDTTGSFQLPIYLADQAMDSLSIIVNEGPPIQISTKAQQPSLLMSTPPPVIEEINALVGEVAILNPCPPKLLKLPSKWSWKK